MGTFYRLATFHQTALRVRASSGIVEHATEQAGGADRATLTAFIPEHAPNICLLFAATAVEPILKIARQEFRELIPLRIIRDAPGTLSLYDSASGMYLCAAPPDAVTGVGEASLDRRTIDHWERFPVRELSALYVDHDVVRLSRQFEEFLRFGLNAEGLIRFLQVAHGPGSMPILEAALHLMAPRQIAFAADWILHRPGALQRLAEIYPEDFDANVALPRLRAWIDRRKSAAIVPMQTAGPGWDGASSGSGSRRGPFALFYRHRAAGPAPRAGPAQPAAPERLGADLDFLAGRGEHGEDVSFPHACNVLLRRAVAPRRDVCVVATARNEGLYLLEWIAYHRLIGVEAFYLYNNGNTDGSDELIAALHRAGILVSIQNEMQSGGRVQAKSYGHALSVLPDVLDFRWVLIIDLDEFFTFDPDRFASIQDYLAWQEVFTVQAIALNWIVLCSGGEVRWRDEPVIRRFVTQLGGAAPFIKSMCHANRFVHSHPHAPTPHRQAPFVFRNSDREMHEWGKLGSAALSDRPVAKHAWINHYFFKSVEEFLCKWARGRTVDLVLRLTNTALTSEFVTQFVNQHVASSALPAAREARAVRDCAPDLDAEIARLLALPGVASAAERIKATFRSQIPGIVEMFADAPGIIEAGEAGQRFLALFHTAPTAQAA